MANATTPREEQPLWIEVVTDTYVPDINGVAMSLGRLCSGLRDLGHHVEVIRSGAGTSRMFEMRAPMMANNRYEPATMRCATWKKDMMVIGDFAAELGCPVPLFSATEPIYDTGLSMGHGALDTAAVCAVLESMAGVKR